MHPAGSGTWTGDWIPSRSMSKPEHRQPPSSWTAPGPGKPSSIYGPRHCFGNRPYPDRAIVTYSGSGIPIPDCSSSPQQRQIGAASPKLSTAQQNRLNTPTTDGSSVLPSTGDRSGETAGNLIAVAPTSSGDIINANQLSSDLRRTFFIDSGYSAFKTAQNGRTRSSFSRRTTAWCICLTAQLERRKLGAYIPICSWIPPIRHRSSTSVLNLLSRKRILTGCSLMLPPLSVVTLTLTIPMG